LFETSTYNLEDSDKAFADEEGAEVDVSQYDRTKREEEDEDEEEESGGVVLSDSD
jgi:hypothetical protein